MTKEVECPVLVVGGGPVGLGMAIELSGREITNVLVDEGDGSVAHPRTGLIAIRTMELARRWGLAVSIRTAGFPDDHELSMVYCTALNGLMLDKEPYPSMRDTPTPPETPEKKQRCPQSWMQPILVAAARRAASSDVRFGHRFEHFVDTGTEVVSQVKNLNTGEPLTIRSQYLVACDGSSSSIRGALGISMQGRLLSYSINILVCIPDFSRQHPLGEAERYLFVGPEGTWGNLTVVDGRDLWRLTVLGSTEKMDLAAFDAGYWVERALGRSDIAYEIHSVVPWRRAEMLAERFRQGRVLLAGDAAHVTSPTGGMGMNTGMQEVFDLGWKLEGTIKGWGGPQLLESYNIERRPVAARNLRFSTSNFHAWKDVPDPHAVLDRTPEGAEARANIGRQMRDATKIEWESLGLQIGHRYDKSPICIPDGSPATPDDFCVYVPTGRPGSRAPHAWLSDGTSTLDLFGRAFVLITFDEAALTAELQSAFSRHGVPLDVVLINDADIAELYGTALVLVRPDGHVAWRGQAVEDAQMISDIARGAGRNA